MMDTQRLPVIQSRCPSTHKRKRVYEDCMKYFTRPRPECQQTCKYRHPVLKSSKWCHAWENTNGMFCPRGADCPFRHWGRRLRPCYSFFERGYCDLDDWQCQYSHRSTYLAENVRNAQTSSQSVQDQYHQRDVVRNYMTPMDPQDFGRTLVHIQTMGIDQSTRQACFSSMSMPQYLDPQNTGWQSNAQIFSGVDSQRQFDCQANFYSQRGKICASPRFQRDITIARRHRLHLQSTEFEVERYKLPCPQGESSSNHVANIPKQALQMVVVPEAQHSKPSIDELRKKVMESVKKNESEKVKAASPTKPGSTGFGVNLKGIQDPNARAAELKKQIRKEAVKSKVPSPEIEPVLEKSLKRRSPSTDPEEFEITHSPSKKGKNLDGSANPKPSSPTSQLTAPVVTERAATSTPFHVVTTKDWSTATVDTYQPSAASSPTYNDAEDEVDWGDDYDDLDIAEAPSYLAADL